MSAATLTASPPPNVAARRRPERHPERLFPDSGLRLALLSAVCVCLYLARVAFTGELRFLFLGWNLLLAWIPWGIACGLLFVERRWALAIGCGAWLLFFPNSFYLITDLAHLGGKSRAPAWFDPALFAAFALAGAMLAVDSLALVERRLREHVSALAGPIAVAGAIVASGFGIWLGRVRRWNSWDVLQQPWDLCHDIALVILRPWESPGAVAATMVYSVLLGTLYLFIRPTRPAA